MNKQAILKRMIILCWLLLAACFIIKLFGGNLFEIAVKNERFILLCNFIDGHKILYNAFSFILYYISTVLYLLAASAKKKFTIKENTFITIILLISFTIKCFCLNLGFIFDIILILFLTFKYCKSIKKTIIAIILLNTFQLVSMFIKNIPIEVLNVNFIEGFVLMIDYYIMIILFYLYTNLLRIKGVIINMGKFGLLWFSEDLAQWEAFRATLTKPKDIAKADKQIARIKAKQNAKV